MSGRRPTWRKVDDERIVGTWRHAWVRNGKNFLLTDLVIYADGVVDCHGLMTVAEFAAKARAGDVLSGPPDDHRNLSAEDFVAKVRDDVEGLNGRPLAEERCMDAAEAFVLEPTEDNRAVLRAAYEEVPQRDHLYAFTSEGPYNRDDIRILVAGLGQEVETLSGTEVVTEELHAMAMRTLIKNRGVARTPRQPPADGPAEPVEPSIVLSSFYTVKNVHRSIRDVRPPHVLVLRNEYPAPIEVAGWSCSVHQAYWALSVADPELRARLLDGDKQDAIATAWEAPRREDWSRMRTAVMAELLRAKFAQHPELAAVLRDTGQARIVYEGVDNFWCQNTRKGRNRMGWLLEQVRSERAASGMVSRELGAGSGL